MNTIKKRSHLVTVDILPTLKFEMIKSLVMAVVYSYSYGLLRKYITSPLKTECLLAKIKRSVVIELLDTYFDISELYTLLSLGLYTPCADLFTAQMVGLIRLCVVILFAKYTNTWIGDTLATGMQVPAGQWTSDMYLQNTRCCMYLN